ncbi:hypothetical protein CDAR_512751 [Caerostris darwini]|uniref:Uncharacterized protein n=1 Tax=Caerostris darwini TaxID=1538125 RepID=A0AAV4SA94_9ARAC|nr:hypothetical protein CDAR_512751 [Caerostris darwini]
MYIRFQDFFSTPSFSNTFEISVGGDSKNKRSTGESRKKRVLKCGAGFASSMPTARCPSTPCAQSEVGGEGYGNAILISISSHYRSASIALRDERNTLQGRREYESTPFSSTRNVSVSKRYKYIEFNFS